MQIETTVPSLPEGLALRPEDVSHPLDAAAVSSWLARQGAAGLDPRVVPRQFAGGLANLNYLVRLGEVWAVLRRPPTGPLPPGANDMAREHRILSRLWQALPLAPRSLHLCADAAVIGVPFQIIEFRSGLTLRGDGLDPLPATPETSARLSDVLVETLARVHMVDPEAVGLGELGRPEGFFRRQVKGWLGRAAEVSGGDLSEAARQVAAWLEDCPEPCATGTVLLHSDIKLDNLLLDPATLQPTTLVDWDMGTRGPALFDLATTLSYWTEPGDPDCMHRLAQMPTARPGFMSREQAATAYARRMGCDIGDIVPWRVLTILKLAVVFLQLHRRHVTGETADPRYASFGALGHDLFAFALDVARGRLF